MTRRWKEEVEGQSKDDPERGNEKSALSLGQSEEDPEEDLLDARLTSLYRAGRQG